VWKQVEDHLVPRLRLSLADRAVYSHLLRHSRLEGKQQIGFSIAWVMRGVRVSDGPARDAVRRLLSKGVLRLVERSRHTGHVVEVLLPEEIEAVRLSMVEEQYRARSREVDLETADFQQSGPLRQAIHARERGRCFYCQRRLTRMIRVLDHVVPRVRFGSNSYRNLVSCCVQCNMQKRERDAEEFLRWLYRENSWSNAELAERLRALRDLAAGRLRPVLAALPRRGRPPLQSYKQGSKEIRM
jgi:5-methylcytosine-specific restriction endonuclease McrA